MSGLEVKLGGGCWGWGSVVVHAKLGVRTASGAVRELTVLVNGGAHGPEPVPGDELGLRGARRRLHR